MNSDILPFGTLIFAKSQYSDAINLWKWAIIGHYDVVTQGYQILFGKKIGENYQNYTGFTTATPVAYNIILPLRHKCPNRL